MTFSISECFVRGFDSFSGLVVNGEFDRIMVRPQSTILQILGSRFEFTRIGRLLQSVGVFVWSLINLTIEWNALKMVTLFLMVVSGVFIFSGIFILAATLCFWTIQGLEVSNIFTDGGREMAQYPLDIYKKWVTRFFTFIIPFGCVNYLPLMFVLGRVDNYGWFYMVTPVYGIVFVIPCLLVWRIGIRHYRSTGS